MKLINRTNTYYGPVFTESTVYGGQIQCTTQEWAQAVNFLMRTSKWVEDSGYVDFYKKILREDIAKGLTTSKGTLFAIRVSATKAIAKRFGLTNYQKRNYTFLVR